MFAPLYARHQKAILLLVPVTIIMASDLAVEKEVAEMPAKEVDDDDDSSSESEDDDLVLEGVMVRNPDVTSSSDDEDDDDAEEDEEDAKQAASGEKRKSISPSRFQNKPNRKKNKQNKSSAEPETIQVEFCFCDMAPVFFHGLKSLLHSTSTVYQQHSSMLADHMIENVSVGTLVSTTEEDQKEGNTFGFASVLNVETYQASPAIQFLKEFCLKHCPQDRRKELDVVLSGKTNRPAGFLLHGRMINLPLEIVLVLHEQLVKDMDWAVKNAQGGEAERKSLDFGVFVRLAPCQKEGGSVIYNYFDDEILAQRCDFHYVVDAPKAYSKEAKEMVSIIVLTKDGLHAAVQDISKIVHG